MVYTQQKLADIFGVARPSLARILSELEDENLISINKRWVTVHHLKALQELAE
ncbi:MAG: helix-turn-helix domain-containing protein [Bacteroidales bacterium]